MLDDSFTVHGSRGRIARLHFPPPLTMARHERVSSPPLAANLGSVAAKSSKRRALIGPHLAALRPLVDGRAER